MESNASRSAILFDLDGTLVDSVADLTVSANEVLAHYGLPPLNGDQVASYVGDGARKLLERCLRGASGAEVSVDDALRRFRAHYLEQCTRLTLPYPGVMVGLQTIQDRALAIVTNKPEPMAERIADALGLRTLLQAVVGARPQVPVKPDPRLLELAVEKLESTGHRIDPSSSWMVGDSRNDILAGRAMGMRTMAVTWGFSPPEQLEEYEPDEIVDSFEEAARLLAAS